MATCEAELIESAAHGDQEAFRSLWEDHHAAAMAAALRLCHQRALAEEITQGAFLLAWRGLPRFKKGCPFRPWLMRILYRRHGAAGVPHALRVLDAPRPARLHSSRPGAVCRSRLVLAEAGAFPRLPRRHLDRALVRSWGHLSRPARTGRTQPGATAQKVGRTLPGRTH